MGLNFLYFFEGSLSLLENQHLHTEKRTKLKQMGLLAYIGMVTGGERAPRRGRVSQDRGPVCEVREAAQRAYMDVDQDPERRQREAERQLKGILLQMSPLGCRWVGEEESENDS